MKLRKRTILALVAALFTATAPAVAVAQTASAASVTNITFWSWSQDMQLAVNLFNQTHPNIHVTLSNVGCCSAEYTKLFASLKAGKPPDVAQLEYQVLPEFRSEGALQDISAYVPSGFGNNFAHWAWAEATSGKAVYAIPQDAGPMVMYYRADLFKKYGLAVPTTWSQYAADAVTLHQDDPSLYITDFDPETNPFLGLILAHGAAWFGTKGNSWTVNIGGPRSRTVAAYWQGLITKGLVTTNLAYTAPWYKQIAGSQVASILGASWASSTFPDNAPLESGDWRVALMPQWPGDQSSGDWGGSTDAVLTGVPTSLVPAAATFAEWLNSNSGSWNLLITKGGIYPAYVPALSNPYLVGPVKYYGNQVIGKTFNQANQQVNTAWEWGPTMTTVFTNWTDLLDAAVANKTTLQAGLTTLEGETVKSMTTAGFSVANQG